MPPTTETQSSTGQDQILTPDAMMLGLTWLVFFVLLFILHKYAWKPILAGLQKREETIRKSLEDADKIKEQLARMEADKIKILNEAKVKAEGIINQSRQVGHELADQIEQKAREEAKDIMANAKQTIQIEYQRARQSIRKESVQTAITLAEKILKENLDKEKNRQLINESMKDV